MGVRPRLRATLFPLGVCLVTVLAPSGAATQEPTLTSVLARVGAYVADFREQLSAVVAEEQYVQTARTVGRGVRGNPELQQNRRRLRSDFLLVRPPGAEHPQEFRDVFEVDGRAVRDREERLSRLFLSQPSSAAQQLRLISLESARYNIGDIERTLNTPTLALVLLHPDFQPRVAFARVDDMAPRLELDRALPDDAGVWVIEYKEARRGTMIVGDGGKDLPAEGRFWVEPDSGRVMQTELIIDDRDVNAVIDVRYEWEPEIELLVPVEMRESYQDRRTGSRVEGTASYSRFRQFTVQVEEDLPPEPAR